jgi:REP element-mobilizing transposase RayT
MRSSVRKPRPNLPGTFFHLTARLQDGKPLFGPRIRYDVINRLRRSALRSDALIVAYVIMSNHLHIVLRQGAQPLHRLMQPFLTSVATLLQTRLGVRGHVFQGRYYDRICRDARHLAMTIAYVHANPVRAGLVRACGDYPWSSCRAYVRTGRVYARAPAVATDIGFAAFTGEDSRTLENWRELTDYWADPNTPESLLWEMSKGGRVTPSIADDRPALGEIAARFTLPAAGSALPIVGRRYGRAHERRARAAFARAARKHGYTGREIAAFLQLSQATVSRMLNRSLPA